MRWELWLRRATSALTVGLVMVAAPAAVASQSAIALRFLGETELPGDLEIDGTLVGGLSGLTYDPECDLYYAVSDDRGSFGPPRFYSLEISWRDHEAMIDVLDATVFRTTDGTAVPGGVVDLEAIAHAPDGTLWVSSEGVPRREIAPFIRRYLSDGSAVDEVVLPDHFIPRPANEVGVRSNLGFEGLSLSPDGTKLFAITENALLQDGPVSDLDVRSPSRILVVEVDQRRAVAEHLYWVEPVPDPPTSEDGFRVNGVSETLAIDDHRLFVLERSFSAGVGNRIRLFLVDLEGASNILGRDSLAASTADVVPVTKTLVADLADLNVKPDNIEGLAIGPRLASGGRLLTMIADNNFQPSVQANQVLLFSISGIDVPNPPRPRSRSSMWRVIPR